MGKNNKYPYGKCFNFVKFLKTICIIANIGFDDKYIINDYKMSIYERVCLTLDMMQNSQGFLSLQSKSAKTYNGKTSQIISPIILDKIKDNLSDKISGNDLRKSSSLFNNFKEVSMIEYINKTYGQDLKKIFEYYCSFGDPLNHKFMKSNKFSKFLNDSNLIKDSKNSKSKGIAMNEVDLIFFKLISSNNKRRASVNSNTKVEFEQFLKSIEIIATHIWKNKNTIEAIDLLMKEHILTKSKRKDSSAEILEQVL
jgi:hypothetical protein